jgi:hypothetical protein
LLVLVLLILPPDDALLALPVEDELLVLFCANTDPITTVDTANAATIAKIAIKFDLDMRT